MNHAEWRERLDRGGVNGEDAFQMWNDWKKKDLAIMAALHDQTRMIEGAFNWREGEPREELYQFLRDFAVRSKQRLVVELVAGWIGCDMAQRK